MSRCYLGRLLLRLYLVGTNFIIRTDHHAWIWILHAAEAACRLARRHPRLIELGFRVIHSVGLKYQAADAISRLPTNETDNKNIQDETSVLSTQQQSRTEKHQLPCSCRLRDDTTANFEPGPIMTFKADDLELSTIVDFVLA